jgi:hypothetical protein
MMPLPFDSAASQSAQSFSTVIGSLETMRANNPSPVCIGVATVGQAPRTFEFPKVTLRP